LFLIRRRNRQDTSSSKKADWWTEEGGISPSRFLEQFQGSTANVWSLLPLSLITVGYWGKKGPERVSLERFHRREKGKNGLMSKKNSLKHPETAQGGGWRGAKPTGSRKKRLQSAGEGGAPPVGPEPDMFPTVRLE